MTEMVSILDQALPQSLRNLAELLDRRTHLFASTGDELLASTSLQTTKDLFDLGLSFEPISHPHLHPFLLSILQPPSVSLRSSTKAKSVEPPKAPQPKDVIPYTPLSTLTTDGMDTEQVWGQLELRAKGVGQVIKEVGAGDAEADEDEAGGSGSDSDSDSDDESGSDEFGSDENMSVEEFKRMMMDRDDSESGTSSGSEESEDGEFSLKKGMGDELGAGIDDDEEEEDGEDESEEGEEGSGDEEDDQEEDEDGEDEELEMDGLSGSDGEETGLDETDISVGVHANALFGDVEDDEAALFGAGPSRPANRKTHPTLDDNFFSIDEFNRVTEEAEAGRLSGGRLGGDEDEEELADVGSMMLHGGDEDESVMYGDFFEAPKSSAAPASRSKKGKGDKGKDKRKIRGVRFDDGEVEKGQNDDAGEEDDDDRGVMVRAKGDLFDDDEEEEEPDEKNLSTHERQQLALAKQIAELEQEAIGPKDWTLLGEASSRARPENSLLEEDLDFEQVGKVVPVVTEDTVKTLEEMIKARIRDNNFNSPVRVRAYEPTPFLPSRYFELQDKQSEKSLAQIYEDEYSSAAAGGKARDPRDEKLKKEHEEIERLWGDICYKLDALSSLNFVPKQVRSTGRYMLTFQPKAQITTINNLPTTSLESGLPPTSAATTLLAPEELFAPPTASALISKSELTPDEKHKARSRSRKAKQTQVRKLGGMAELYGKKKGTKAEKDRALAGLVKTGKGVTVVGKGEKEVGKARKRASEGDRERSDGKRLKL